MLLIQLRKATKILILGINLEHLPNLFKYKEMAKELIKPPFIKNKWFITLKNMMKNKNMIESC